MGRSLKKKYFGTPVQDLEKIQITYLDSEMGTSNGTIKRQVGTRKYLVLDETTGTYAPFSLRSYDAFTVVSSSGTHGPVALVFVTPPGGEGMEFARTISNHRVHTWEGGNYSWSLDPADNATRALIQSVDVA